MKIIIEGISLKNSLTPKGPLSPWGTKWISGKFL